jgi:hypothetical protein
MRRELPLCGRSTPRFARHGRSFRSVWLKLPLALPTTFDELTCP